jgi:hypothetical protein
VSTFASRIFCHNLLYFVCAKNFITYKNKQTNSLRVYSGSYENIKSSLEAWFIGHLRPMEQNIMGSNPVKDIFK